MPQFNRIGIRILTKEDMGKYDVPKDPQDKKRYPTLDNAFRKQIDAYRGKEE